MFAVILWGLVARAAAETVQYPAAEPRFTIEVPEGWAVRNEPDGPLMIQNEDVSVVMVFDSRLRGVDDLATAKEAAALQVKKTVETTGFTDLREIRGVQEMQLNDEIKGVGAQFHAKFPSGEPCIYMVMIFAPDGANYCSAEFSIKARALLPEAEKVRNAIIDSIAKVDEP